MGLLDLLFPKYCVSCRRLGSYICANCFSFISFDTQEICLVCNRASVDGLTHPSCRGKFTIDGAFTAIAYKGIIKKLLYQFKYKPYVSGLAEVLTDLYYESLIQKEQFDHVQRLNPVLSPIPLHPTKFKKRGYNQAKILSDGLSKKLKLPTTQLLVRTRKTESQYGLKRDERKENIKNAFAVSPNILVSQYPNIFLIDDILTTGSTLLEAARILKRNGAKKVWGIALARDE